MINTILGGRFTSWLNDELRVNSGLTYGARSGFSALREGGSFSMSTFTANETTEQTIDLLLKTYQKIHETGIDSKTLESAKNYVKGQFPPDYETNAAIARFFTDADTYELPLDYIDRFNEAVKPYNTKLRSFPTVMFAGILGFDKKPYYEAEEGSEKAPEVKFEF